MSRRSTMGPLNFRCCLWVLLAAISAITGCNSPSDGTVIRKERHSRNAHQGRVRSLSVAPDGNRLVSGSEDGTIKIWDLANWEIESTIQETGNPPAKILSV